MFPPAFSTPRRSVCAPGYVAASILSQATPCKEFHDVADACEPVAHAAR
jgi:hypothetical protein